MTTDMITREKWIAAPPQRVWEVLTRPEHLSRWFAAGGAEIDLRPGGQLVLHWPEWGRFLGRIERVDPPATLSFRWARPPDAEPDATNSSLVEFTLRAEGDGTLLQVVETGLLSAQHLEENTAGWEGGLAELATYVETVAA